MRNVQGMETASTESTERGRASSGEVWKICLGNVSKDQIIPDFVCHVKKLVS